jgi:hypothetical protein
VSNHPSIELPLRPSRTLRRARWLLLVLQSCFVLELLLERHWAAAILAGLCGFTGMSAGQSRMPCRLQLHADGECFAFDRAGDRHRVILLPSTVVLGSHVLLVWRCAQGRRSVLLGPDNVEAGQLAALRRRLSRAAVTVGAGSGTALHSVAVQGSNSPNSP